MSRRLAAVLVVFALSACPGKSDTDAGVDSGSGGGTGGTGGGTGGGSGGGAASDDACDFGGPRTCAAGSSCTLALLEDGGIAKRCIAGECDLIEQDCDAGMKCSFLDGGRACVADGALNEGQACAGATVGCRKGLACTFLGSDGGSTCARFCRVSNDCGAPQQCYVTLVLPETNERPLVCADPPMTCDPLMQNCVNTNDGCYPGSSGAGCFLAGTAAPGDTCTYSNDCQKGSACSGSGGMTRCRQLCAFPAGSAGPACDAGTCTRLTSSQNVGVCL